MRFASVLPPEFFRSPLVEVTKLRVGRDRSFLQVEFGDYKGSGVITGFSSPFGINLRLMIHLPGLRGNPERTYPIAAVGKAFPGTFEKYTASVISQWQREKSPRVNALGRSLDAMDLTWKVEAHGVSDSSVELQVARLPREGRNSASDMISVADVGLGISQVLPVLVALLAAEPGQLLYIEQPELHLHPRAQLRMSRLLADAAKRGVRVVVETHSSLVLRGIQTLVADGELDPGLVKLHWFKRSPKDGMTHVHSADLDREGAFGDWPEDFDETALEAEKAYLNAAVDRKAHA